MKHDTSEQPELPAPPPMKRRLLLYRHQWIGLPIFMLIPILAVLNVFGPTFENASAAGKSVSLSVRYPIRTRFKLTGALELSVHNTSTAALHVATIRVEGDYLESFSNVQVMPSVSRITDGDLEIDLEDLAAGETRGVLIDVTPDIYGLHQGNISLTTDESDAAQVNITTFIFP